MKRTKHVLFAFIAVLIVSAISIGLNIKSVMEQDRIRGYTINQAYSELTKISFNLEGLIYNVENAITDDDTNRQSLTMISHSFVRLDTILKQYSNYFSHQRGGRNIYASIFDFDFISYTLTGGTGTANGTVYNGILVDDAISENELRYLETLRDDIDLIVADMVSSDNPPQENQNLTASQLDNILNTFFDKWSFHNAESPYFILGIE